MENFNKFIDSLNDDIQQLNIICRYALQEDFMPNDTFATNYTQITYLNKKIEQNYKEWLDNVLQELSEGLKGKSIEVKDKILNSYWDKLKFFSKDALTNPSNINQNIIAFKSQYEVFNCNGLKVFHAGTKNEVEKAYNTDCFNKIAIAIAEAIIGLNMYLKKLYNGFDSTGGASIKIDESTNTQGNSSLTKSNHETDQLKIVFLSQAIEPFKEIEQRLVENSFLSSDYSLKGQKKGLLAFIYILKDKGYLKPIRGKAKHLHFKQYRQFFEKRYNTNLKEVAKPSKFNPETDVGNFVPDFFFVEQL